MTFCVFSIIAFYAKNYYSPEIWSVDVFATTTIKESHGILHICEFPVSILKAITAAVNTETNQVVVRGCIVERETVNIREQYQQNAHFFLLIFSIKLSSTIIFSVIKPTRCTNFKNLFCHETLHVSDRSSVHHQEFIHCTLSNAICHTGL